MSESVLSYVTYATKLKTRTLESIVAGVAREVLGCLVRGEGERVDVLLTLLEALGGEPA